MSICANVKPLLFVWLTLSVGYQLMKSAVNEMDTKAVQMPVERGCRFSKTKFGFGMVRISYRAARPSIDLKRYCRSITDHGDRRETAKEARQCHKPLSEVIEADVRATSFS
jgi:hypothetical protein